MRTRIKVCCIASRQEAAQAVAAGADALGLVGQMPSGPGPIPDKAIAEIAALAPPAVAAFLLTSETTAEAISAHIRRTRPSTVQIVSHIALEEAAKLAMLEPHVRRVQVIHVEGPDALDRGLAYSPYIDAFLLDSGRPTASIAELGGTGRTHDWSISARFVAASDKPVFLAGGLGAENVGKAIRLVHPFGVDICSGVRTGGHLDAKKLQAFVRAVAEADSSLESACDYPSKIRLRPSTPEDADRVVEIWRDAVDATHQFLRPQDRADIEAEVHAFLPAMPLLLAATDQDRPVGFMALHDGRVEALFVDPAYRGGGIGKRLIEHAAELHGELTTDVNAQNHRAVGFYDRLGFVATGSSPVDDRGRPYPLLHLRRSKR